MSDSTDGSTVLLVEDSPTQMTYFRGMLEKAGYRVRTARNGAEALICLGEEMSELVVSDCNMPLLDGFQLCRLLKDHPTTRHIPILLLTGNPNRLSRFWARTCGADRFLLKNGTPEQFLEVMGSLAAMAEHYKSEEDSGIWQMGLKHPSPLRVEDITVQLSLALEHRLLEITVRNAVASLQSCIQDPAQVAWGFLNLFQDLVSPGALYFMCPSMAGYVCYVLTSPSIPSPVLDGLLEPLNCLPYLHATPPEYETHIMDWEPGKATGLIRKHFPLRAPSCNIDGQWGMLIERETYQVHRNLFKEASAEFGMVFQVMVVQSLLEAANAKLKQADEAKTAFLLTLSHDMRSPLGGLQVALDSMQARGDEVPEKFRNWVDVGLRSVERLIRLANGVLDLEKIEAGSFEFQPILVDAATMGVETLKAMEPLAGARQIRLIQRPEAASGYWIRVDPDRFQQIMINLVSNAIKFSPSPGEIEIGLVREGKNVIVSVRDQGPGVPEAFMGRIFGKFQQAERKASGSGLGLAISKQLAERMGGHIRFESETGKGACFDVCFPADTLGSVPK